MATGLLAALLTLLAGPAARAQAPGWAGATSGSLTQTSGTSTSKVVAADASGNLFVTGYFLGSVVFGSTVLSSAGGTGLFVTKYVPSTGTWAWATRAGGTSADQGNGIAVSTPSGGISPSIYVTGSFTNTSTNAAGVLFGTTPQLGANSMSSTDLVLAKYLDNGTTGTFQWSQVSSGISADAAYGVAVSTSVSGGSPSVYVAGVFVPAATFGSTTIAGPAVATTNMLAYLPANLLAPLPVQLTAFTTMAQGRTAVRLA